MGPSDACRNLSKKNLKKSPVYKCPGPFCYNKTMIIITAGRKYLDIDAFSSMIAYRELLRMASDEEVLACSTAQINQTVPPMLRNHVLDELPADISAAKFILLDVSNPDFFDGFVNLNQIIEIFDHHPGHEDFWRSRSWVKAQIEPVGAVCTQVFEKFVEAGRTDLLSPELCKLLIAGILDNTINFGSKITSERDREAYRKLLEIGGVAGDWYKEYFLACEREQTKDLKGAILSDVKSEWISPLLPETVGQIILFDRNRINRDVLSEIFADFARRMINVISIEDGRSYLYASDDEILQNLDKLFRTNSTPGGPVVLDGVILRKEIFKRALDYQG